MPAAKQMEFRYDKLNSLNPSSSLNLSRFECDYVGYDGHWEVGYLLYHPQFVAEMCLYFISILILNSLIDLNLSM